MQERCYFLRTSRAASWEQVSGLRGGVEGVRESPGWGCCRAGGGTVSRHPAWRRGSGRREAALLSTLKAGFPGTLRRAHVPPAFLTQNQFLCSAEGVGEWREARREGPVPPPPPLDCVELGRQLPRCPARSPSSFIPHLGLGPGFPGTPSRRLLKESGWAGFWSDPLRRLSALPALVTLGRSVFPSASGSPRGMQERVETDDWRAPF